MGVQVTIEWQHWGRGQKAAHGGYELMWENAQRVFLWRVADAATGEWVANGRTPQRMQARVAAEKAARQVIVLKNGRWP